MLFVQWSVDFTYVFFCEEKERNNLRDYCVGSMRNICYELCLVICDWSQACDVGSDSCAES